jgi:hypothetical protein
MVVNVDGMDHVVTTVAVGAPREYDVRVVRVVNVDPI